VYHACELARRRSSLYALVKLVVGVNVQRR
jgi:hypothetical protein